jgi:hypothetical protein
VIEKGKKIIRESATTEIAIPNRTTTSTKAILRTAKVNKVRRVFGLRLIYSCPKKMKDSDIVRTAEAKPKNKITSVESLKSSADACPTEEWSRRIGIKE